MVNIIYASTVFWSSELCFDGRRAAFSFIFPERRDCNELTLLCLPSNAPSVYNVVGDSVGSISNSNVSWFFEMLIFGEFLTGLLFCFESI